MKSKAFVCVISGVLVLAVAPTVADGRLGATAPTVAEGRAERIERFAAEGDRALADRLLMYWDTRATDVFVRDQAVVGVGGAAAPVPTVMFDGNRSHVTVYKRPRIEDLPRRAEDARGLFLEPKDGGDRVWVPYGKTGTIVCSVNTEILGLAVDAVGCGFTNLAYGVLDTYLPGILHRHVATDLGHGHMQTLFGMQSMETIHDNTLAKACDLYSLLKGYVAAQHPDRLADYQAALKKWAEVQIANGVADNNWDIMQLNAILDVACVLEPDAAYADGKGREHYLDVVMNRSSVRNLSVRDLCERGFDPQTGIWWECPGYSMVTLKDLAKFAAKVKEKAGIDLYAEIPVLRKAFAAAAEYLFPDNMLIGFGDTHPAELPQEVQREREGIRDWGLGTRGGQVVSRPFRAGGEEKIAASTPSPQSLVPSPFFYAPNASWLVARSGMDRTNDVAFALNASLGNHQHANGISLELYARGYRLAPDAGIGWSLYSGEDYKEYYSQFPAHNTVMVNSRSTYQVMKSHHPFELAAHGDDWATVRFREPATGAEQERTVKYVKDADGAYFVDVFRSRVPPASHERLGAIAPVAQTAPEWHDYYYHNFGDTLELNGTVRPTEEVAFVESGLYGLSYIQEKFARDGSGDLVATFDWSRPEGRIVTRVFMNDATGRTFIKALAPATEGLSRVKSPDYGITRDSRTPVLVVRQRGEAWERPFLAVIDPTGTVAGVEYLPREIRVHRTSGQIDTHAW